MGEARISVVVPVYNTEKYLDQCVRSIVNQTYGNLQILLIDDGSTDSSAQKCDAWAEKDSRITVIHKANAGLGHTRNTGIDHAAGEYICFFDSDDYLAPDAIEKAYERACFAQAELVTFGFSTVSEKGEVIWSQIPSTGAITYQGSQVQTCFLPELIAPDPKGDGRQQFQMSAWAMLLSMDVIRRSGWRFVSEREIVAEDVYSLLELVSYVDRVAVLPEALYYYRTSEGSLSRKYRPGRYKETAHFYQECIRLCEQLRYGEKIMHRLCTPYLAFTVTALKQEAAAHDRKAALARLRRVIDDPLLQRVLQQIRHDNMSIKKRILFRAMRRKRYGLCYGLLAAQNARQNNRSKGMKP